MASVKYSVEVWGLDGGGTETFRTKKDASAYLTGLAKKYKAEGYRLKKYVEGDEIGYADEEENMIVLSTWYED